MLEHDLLLFGPLLRLWFEFSRQRRRFVDVVIAKVQQTDGLVYIIRVFVDHLAQVLIHLFVAHFLRRTPYEVGFFRDIWTVRVFVQLHFKFFFWELFGRFIRC